MTNRTDLIMRRRAILILGMHRSGTSALTRALNLAGMRLATDLSNPNEFNDKGYWESQEIQKINDSLLVETNSAWFDSFSWSKDLLSTDEYEVHINEIVEFLEREFTTDNSFIFASQERRKRVILAPLTRPTLGYASQERNSVWQMERVTMPVWERYCQASKIAQSWVMKIATASQISRIWTNAYARRE